MSQWAALVTRPNRALDLYRDKDFPLDVRHHLAHYIESRSWMSLPPTRAPEELGGLINALDTKVVELQNTGQVDHVLASHKLSQCRTQLINMYGKNPVLLLQTLSILLQTEHKLLTDEFQQQCMSPMGQGAPMTPMTPMTPVLTQTPSGLPAISNTLTNLDSWGQSANIICQYLGNTKDVLNKMSPHKRGAMQGKMKRLQGNLDKHLQTMEQARRYLRSSIDTTVEKLCRQNGIILQNIAEYKLAQRRALVGFEGQVNINDLEVKVKSHVVELETCLQQIRLAVRHYSTVKDISSNCPDDSRIIMSLRDKVVKLIKELISSSLVIEELPSAILKKDTKFAATLRLLVGGHFGIKMNLPEVTCSLVSFSQIQSILSGGVEPHNTGCGDILNGSNVMEHFPSNNSVKLFMKKLMLKKYTRAAASADKAGEERYGLCFASKLSLHLLEEQAITLCCISPSLALIVHTRQIALAEAAVIWDNSFCSDGEKPPEEVTWGQLGQVLNSWFTLHTGRGLSEDNVRCLGRKLLRSEHVTQSDTVSWKSFAKENLVERTFSFWDWVYSAYDLIDKCLKDLWKDGLVEGYISKEEVQRLLSKCEPNTFILRFSDSMVGGISASWLHQEPGGRQGEILHLEPNTHRGLSYISLAERIIGLHDLKVLYPNKPKNQVFSNYIKKREMGASDTEYVRQNISVSVDLPRHHSAPLLSTDSSFNSTLNSPTAPYLDDDLFDSLDCSEFNVSPTGGHEMTDDQYAAPHPDSMYTDTSIYSVGELEPSLADLDLDSLIHTAQNNLNSISNSTNNGSSSSEHMNSFFGDW